MSAMEAIKFVMFYGMEIVVVALVGITLFAGLYQLIRGKVRQSRASKPAVTPETIRR
jgi:hypothetical protein